MDQPCWGCRKRRVVCDLGKPGCAKCKKAGIDCLGYGKQKPLQWLAVGKVKSREKKKRPKVTVSAVKGVEQNTEEEVATTTNSDRASSKENDRALVTLSHRPKAKVQYKVEAEIELFEEAVPNLGIQDETTDVVQAVFYCGLISSFLRCLFDEVFD